MAPTMIKPPTGEIGITSNHGTMSWGLLTDDNEKVPELRYPRSVIEYNRMRNDAQVEALDAGSTLPITNFSWMLKRNGASDDVLYRLSDNFGLPIEDEVEEVDDSDWTINHDEHLRHVLLAPLYGHMFMEQVLEQDSDGWFMYRKLAPRMPLTIGSIETETDGGLKGIRLNISKPGQMPPLIPTDRLVAFVWKREGANWCGRSMLRPLYGNWLLKQRLMRVDATKHERNGMGIPFAKQTHESTGRRALAAAAKMATLVRSGMNSGGALPFGTDLEIKGVQGTLPDTLASIKYHDEAMARALLLMHIMLGQTETGSRSLGDSFMNFHFLALQAKAKWYANIMYKHVFRDWVLWNVPETQNRKVPKLVYKSPPPEVTVQDFVALIGSGITMDGPLEEWVRGRYGMPPAAPAGVVKAMRDAARLTGIMPPINASLPVGRRRTRPRMHQGATTSIALPSRTLSRVPFEHEVQAAVDYAALDQQHADAVTALVTAWQDVRAGQINELVDVIAATDASDLAALSSIEAGSGPGKALIKGIMHELAVSGAEGALAEAAEQGEDVAMPKLTPVKSELTKRAGAVDTLLTRSISEAAARKATSLGGGGLEADEIANEVRTYLEGLSDAYLDEQFTGVVSQAQNAGRRAVFDVSKPTRVYASELLDTNTCETCAAIDGKEYKTMTGALKDYPTGGYHKCQGGPRCRGIVVGVYENA